MRALSESVRLAARALEEAGWAPDDSRLDAEALARSLLKWDMADWLSRQREPAADAFELAFTAVVRRRLEHEPVAYIVGEREFYGRPFRVTPDVLIPRPETELVVDLALSILSSEHADGRTAVVDVGTGSGCLAISLVLEVPAITVTATDVSAGALAVAACNAAHFGVHERVRFVNTSLIDRIPGPFDLIVSNPPYVAEGDRDALMPDVRHYEPGLALLGGPDGLAVIRALLAAAGAGLRRGGWLVMEIGAGQSASVTAMVGRSRHLSLVQVTPDLSGIPRVLVARRTEHSSSL